MIKSLFYNLPYPIKCGLVTIVGYRKNNIRYSGKFKLWYSYFKNNSKLPKEKLNKLIIEKLNKHIWYARSNPYYNEIFRKNEIKSHEISSLDEFRLFPCLEKDLVRRNPSLFLRRPKSRKIYWKRTSGSTGSPMRVPWTKDVEQMNWGFVWARARHGVERSDSYSSFTGVDLWGAQQKDTPLWVTNYASKQRLFSIFHMSDSSLGKYLERMESGYNDYFVGYPHALALVADYMLKNGIRLSRKPKGVFCSSAILLPQHRAAIEEAFGCKVWDHYGQVELACAITEYECGKLHVDNDYGYVDLYPVEELESGERIAEIVATNFNNDTWQLIKYKTGDLVCYHPDDRCDCGHPGLVVRRIIGRTAEYISLPSGKKIFNITVIIQKLDNIDRIQLIQISATEVIVKVVRGLGYSMRDERNLIRVLKERIGDEVEYRIEYVSDIVRSSNGKYMLIINRCG